VVRDLTRKVHDDERRARLAVRHHLAPAARVDDVVEAARGVVALHATDPATVFLAAAARMRRPDVAAIESALYDDRTLVRLLGMRRTVFVVPVDLVPVVQVACAQPIAVRERVRLVEMIEAAGIADDGEAWVRRVEDVTVAALAARGSALASELSAEVPDLRRSIPFGEGKKWAGTINISTRLLFVLAAEGRIVRGRPRGSWTSTLYRWHPMEAWLPGGIAEVVAEEARAELVRRWLARFGPGTVADLKWWTGWTVAQVKQALGRLEVVEVVLDDGSGFVLADDVDEVTSPGPWVALLPALDPTVMGWTGRDWYLGEHGPALFDRSGNPGPTVWCDGRIVGGWVQRKDGEIAMRLLEDIGTEATAAVDEAAGRLGTWLGDVRVTPRFRTPLERELSA
jgi:hypothetical protein